MKNCIKFLCLALIFNFSLFLPLHLYSSDQLKIQRVLDTGGETNCITQDKDGLLWVSVWGKGLFTYDGEEFEKVVIPGTKNSSPIIWSILVDRDGVIWYVIQNQGLYSYNKKTGVSREYKTERGNPNSLINNIFEISPNILAEDKDGTIWIGTEGGLNSYSKKTGKFTQYKHSSQDPNSLSNNDIWSIFVDREGLIWVGTADGLNCYNKRTGEFYHYRHDPKNPNSLSDNFVRAITEDKDGNLWIGTKKSGIDKFDKKTDTFTNYRNNPKNPNSLSCNQIHSLMVDRFDNLWICNEGHTGIDIFNPKANTFKHYSSDPENPNTISSNNRLYSFEDSTGVVWLIDGSGDIDKCIWMKDTFRNYIYSPKKPFGISSDDIAKLYKDKEGNIWIGTYKGGLCLYTKHGDSEGFKHIKGLPGNSIHSILDAPGAKLWLGIEEGMISLFDIKTEKILKTFKNPYQLTPCYLTQDNKNPNVLWFACSYAGGLFKFNIKTGEFTRYKHIPGDLNSVSDKNTFSILQDGGFLWLATGGDGLIKFDKRTGNCIYYKHDPNNENSISGNVVIESYIDHKGNFWVATDDGGLNKFYKSTGKFVHYGIKDGFSSKSTRHILRDHEGYLWISTDSGIVKFDPETLKVVKIFTKTDGLASNQLDRVANPIKDSEGDFWFSSEGVCRFSPEEANKIQRNPHIPPIILTSFKSKAGTYHGDVGRKPTAVKLPSSDNSFKFTFTALDYTDPLKNQYAYRLEGFEKDWNFIGTNHFGQYANLKPGEYTLRLRGSNNDGIWNEKGTSIKITIVPAFWEIWWVEVLAGILAAAIIFLLVWLRMRALKRQAKVLVGHNIALNKEIKERQKAETELSKTTEALHKVELDSERDHAIAETTSLVAHDVRQPFSQLKVILEMLPEFTPEEIEDCSRDLDISIRKVEAMLADIMELSREREYDLTPESLLSVLDLAIKDVIHCWPDKKVNFYYKLDDAIPLAKLDEQRLCRAFDNIITNAFDVMPEKGAFMWFSIKRKGRQAEIVIGNSHSNIPEERIDYIFQDRFTYGKKQGTGLGLRIVYKVVDGHNGSVSVRNVTTAPDFVPKKLNDLGGVEFIVTLPLTKKEGYGLREPLLKNSRSEKLTPEMVQKDNYLAGASLIDALAEKLRTSSESPNMLILDDASIYRMRVRDVLESLGEVNELIRTYDAGTYKEAIDVLNETKIDYLVCDIDLSDKQNSGFSVLSEALKRYPDCKVLMHTCLLRKSSAIEKAKKIGACGFCSKPITEAVLVDLLLDKELWADAGEDAG